MALRDTTRRINSLVESISGYPVLVTEDASLQTLATVKNVRAGKRRGAVGLDSRELAAEFVLVSEAQKENVELWAVTGEPILVTQEQLLQMGYPDPRGDLYYCLELERLVDAGSTTGITPGNVEGIRKQVPGKVRGAPVAVTWLALVNAS